MSRPRRARASAVAIAGAAALATFALALAAALIADPASPLHAVPRLSVVAPAADAWGTSWDDLARPAADGLRAGLVALVRLFGQIVAGALLIAGLSLVLHGTSRVVVRRDEFAVRRILGARSPHLLRIGLTDLLSAALAGCLLGAAAGAATGAWLLARRPVLLAAPATGGRWDAVVGVTLAIAVLLAFVATALIALGRRREATGLHGEQVTAPGRVLAAQSALAALQFGGLLAIAYVGVLVMRDAGRAGPGTRLPYPADAVTMDARLQPGSEAADARRAMHAALASGPGSPVLATPGAWLGLGRQVTATTVCGDCFIGSAFAPLNSAPVTAVAVSPESLTRMQVRLVSGRDIATDDGPGAPRAAILSTVAAAALFPGADPIGQTLSLGPAADARYAVVGIAEAVAPGGLASGGVAVPMLYLSLLQHPVASVELTARPRDLPLALATLRAAAGSGAPVRRVSTPTPLARRLDAMAAPVAWLSTWLLIVAAASGLVAVVALTASMGRIVDERRREIAIRLALGAPRRTIARWMLGKAARIASAGLVIGLSVARWLGDLLRRDVAGPVSADLLDLLVLSGVLAAVAVAANLVPALRATRVAPAAVWRREP